MKAMIKYKTPEEIETMRECGLRLRRATTKLLPLIHAGMTTDEVDKHAKRLIEEEGAETSFTRVPGYHWTTCVPVNEQVVHTPPGKRTLKKGDILTIDCGAYFRGYHTDWATTLMIDQKPTGEIAAFLDTGRQALTEAIAVVKAGNRLGDIAQVIQDRIYGKGYFIMKQLTGHGIGKDLHEDPYVLNYVDRPKEKTLKMKPGLVIAVEVIYSMGTEEIAYEKGEDWSIVTADGSLSACYEHTLAITDKNTVILT